MSAELHTFLSSTLNEYTPLFTKTSITRPDSSRYTISLLKQKRILRKAEKSYLKHLPLLHLHTKITYKISTEKLFILPKPLTSPSNLTNSLMTVSPYTYFLLNCLVVHLNPLSPLPTIF